MSSLAILIAAVFEIPCGKTDRQTDRQTPVTTVPLDWHQRGYKTRLQCPAGVLWMLTVYCF